MGKYIIYAEWRLAEKFDNGFFYDRESYYEKTFNPDIEILEVRILK